jgi:hypothetical protein
MNLIVGDWVNVKLPFFTKGRIHTIFPDGRITLEGLELYSFREKHLEKIEEE